MGIHRRYSLSQLTQRKSRGPRPFFIASKIKSDFVLLMLQTFIFYHFFKRTAMFVMMCTVKLLGLVRILNALAIGLAVYTVRSLHQCDSNGSNQLVKIIVLHVLEVCQQNILLKLSLLVKKTRLVPIQARLFTFSTLLSFILVHQEAFAANQILNT